MQTFQLIEGLAPETRVQCSITTHIVPSQGEADCTLRQNFTEAQSKPECKSLQCNVTCITVLARANGDFWGLGLNKL